MVKRPTGRVWMHSSPPLRVFALAVFPPALLLAAETPATGEADVLPLLLAGGVVLLLALGFTALCVTCQAMRPTQTRGASILAGRSPVRSLVYGLLTTVIVILQLSLSKALPPFLGGLLTVVFVIPAFWFLVVGATAISHALGEKLLTNAGSPKQFSDVWAVACGSALLGLINLMPILGQVVTVCAFGIGLGASVRQALRRKRPSREPVAESEMPLPDHPATKDAEGTAVRDSA